jgi:hypothetical protein
MCAWFKYFPEFGVTLNVYSGKLTPDVMLRFIDSIDSNVGSNWVNYLDPTLDLSGMDVEHFPVLRRALANKMRELYGEAHVRCALVSASPENELFSRFWTSYVGPDVQYPAEAVEFPTLQAACHWLGLSKQVSKTLAEAVEA